MYCVKCGANLPDDARFCPKCGKAVAIDAEDETVTCEKADIQEKSSENQTASVSLSEADMVDAICPHCGFNGKMQIVERNNISAGNKIILYVVCYGGLFFLAYLLELILVPLFPTWVLYIFGFCVGGVALKKISTFIKNVSVKRVICPQCKNILEFRQK